MSELVAPGAITGSVPKGTHGVVGMTPVLKPGEGNICHPTVSRGEHEAGQRFEYHSGVELTTKEGRMSGSFQMVCIEQRVPVAES